MQNPYLAASNINGEQRENYDQPVVTEFDDARNQLLVAACVLDIAQRLGLSGEASQELAKVWSANSDSIGRSAFDLWDAINMSGDVSGNTYEVLDGTVVAPVVDLDNYREARKEREEVVTKIEELGGLNPGMSDSYLDEVSALLLPEEHPSSNEGEYREDNVRNWRLHIEYAARRREDTASELIREYQSFVGSRVKKIGVNPRDFEDAMQVGNLGLYQSIDRFDPLRGVPFIGFAIQYVDGNIKRHFRDYGSTIRIPRNLYELSPAVERAIEELRDDEGVDPTNEDIAAYLEVEVDRVDQVRDRSHAKRVSSYDGSSNPEQEGSLLDFLQSTPNGLDLDESEMATLFADLQSAIKTLDPKMQEIIYLRFYEDLSQQAIGERVGISQAHIGRLLQSAFGQLRIALGKGVL